jgi:hypothetical protein
MVHATKLRNGVILKKLLISLACTATFAMGTGVGYWWGCTETQVDVDALQGTLDALNEQRIERSKEFPRIKNLPKVAVADLN